MTQSATGPTSPKIVFVDGSYHMNKARNAKEEYLAEHIPGARYFDIDSVCDSTVPLPHMVPTEQHWKESMVHLGIREQDHVVVYTHAGAMSGPRVWYLFTAFGHKKVSLMNGGLSGWKRAGGSVASMTAEDAVPAQAAHVALAGLGARQAETWRLKRQFVAGKDDVLHAMHSGRAQILDARAAARFNGTAPEPREGLVSGCIPGSLNIPYTEFIVGDDSTTFRSKVEIRDTFKEAGVVFGSRVISSCGSGVTACYAALGMSLIGRPLSDIPVYDGSWSEWGAPKNGLPKLTKDGVIEEN